MYILHIFVFLYFYVYIWFNLYPIKLRKKRSVLSKIYFFFQQILISEPRGQDIKLDLNYLVALMFLIFLSLERIKACI